MRIYFFLLAILSTFLLSEENIIKQENNKLIEYRVSQIENVNINLQTENEKLKIKILALENKYKEIMKDTKNDQNKEAIIYKDMLQNTNDLYSNQINTFQIILILIGSIIALLSFIGWGQIIKTIDSKIKEIILNKSQNNIDLLDNKINELNERLRATIEKDVSKQTENDKYILDLISKELINKKDKTEEDWFYMGLEEEKNQEYDKAIKAYKEVVKINPKHRQALFNIAVSYGKSGEYHNSINAYENILKLSPSKDIEILAYYNIAIMYTAENLPIKAKEYYYKAYEINPNYVPIYNNLFELNLTNGEEIDEKVYKKYLENCKDDDRQNMIFDMLNIMRTVEKGIDADSKIIDWKSKYKDIGFKNWQFDDMEKWIQSKEDGVIKSNLLNTIKTFRKLDN